MGGNPKTTICYFHSMGGCSKPSCKFQHPLPPSDVCGFRHPSASREARREQAVDLKEKAQLTDIPVIQNNKPSSTPSATPSASTSCVRSAVKRKSSSNGEQSSGPRPKRSIPQTESEARFGENEYYQVTFKSDNLKGCDQDLVKFKQFVTSCQGSRQVEVLNVFDEAVSIPSSSLEKQFVLSSSTRPCPFTSCKDVRFNSEKPYMEHIILEHFYQKFSNVLKSSYSQAENRFRCPQKNCSESFSNIKDICLHYGGFPHAKVIGLLFNSIDISMSQNGKENKCELSDLKKKITEKEEELSRLKSSHIIHLTVKDEEIEDQKKKVENLSSKLQEKEARLKSQDAKIKDHERRLKENGRKVKVQESKLNELVEKLNNQATKLKNQETKIRNQELKLKEEETKITEKLREKETHDIPKEVFEAQEEKFKNQEVKLKCKLNEAKLQIEQLQIKLKEKNIAMNKADESKVESEKNVKSLDKLEKENELLKKDVQNMEALNLRVSNVMHKTNLKSVQAKREFQQKEKELEKRIATLHTEKKELENILTQSREAQGKTDRDYLELRDEFEFQSADLTNFQSDIEAFTREKEELLGSLTDMSTEVVNLKREKEELRENLTKMEEERDSMDEINMKLSLEIKLLKKPQDQEVQRTELENVMRKRIS